mmetsp:Transcript_1343/g.2256  ORF Transcript_1343/g.2256 Transcript_1343/m.2256 type:complete len:94 (+) Transcript_1343:2221-2502(+)
MSFSHCKSLPSIFDIAGRCTAWCLMIASKCNGLQSFREKPGKNTLKHTHTQNPCPGTQTETGTQETWNHDSSLGQKRTFTYPPPPLWGGVVGG